MRRVQQNSVLTNIYAIYVYTYVHLWHRPSLPHPSYKLKVKFPVRDDHQWFRVGIWYTYIHILLPTHADLGKRMAQLNTV